MADYVRMYLRIVAIKQSGIEGKGDFTEEDIIEGNIVWKFNAQHDHALPVENYEKLNETDKADIRKVGYVSPTSSKWVYPPDGDPARFTNHSETNNNLTAKFDRTISCEPLFVANRDITQGEELIVNYVEFDASIQQGRPIWMQDNK